MLLQHERAQYIRRRFFQEHSRISCLELWVTLPLLPPSLLYLRPMIAGLICKNICLFTPNSPASHFELPGRRHQVGHKPLAVYLLVRSAWGEEANDVTTIFQYP